MQEARAAVLRAAVSAVLLGAASWGSAAADDLGAQVRWLDLAVLGLVASGATCSVGAMPGK